MVDQKQESNICKRKDTCLYVFDNDTTWIAGFEIHEDLQEGKCTGSVQVKAVYVDNINQYIL